MDFKKGCVIGKFITLGFLCGNKCSIQSLKNGQQEWERMPLLTPAEKNKLLKNSKDKTSDFNINRLENYSAADSIDFKKFLEKCFDFCDDIDKNDV